MMTRISRHYSWASQKIQLKHKMERYCLSRVDVCSQLSRRYSRAPRGFYTRLPAQSFCGRGPPVRRSTFTRRCCIIGPMCLLVVLLHLPLAPLHEHQYLRSRTKASLGIYALAAPLGGRTAVGYICELSKKWRRPYTLAYFRGTRCLEPGFCRVYPEIHSNIIHTPSGYALSSGVWIMFSDNPGSKYYIFYFRSKRVCLWLNNVWKLRSWAFLDIILTVNRHVYQNHSPDLHNKRWWLF